MGKRLYVGNLPYSARDESLVRAFSAFGQILSAKVMTDGDTGRSKGYGFVEMGSDGEAQAATRGMNGEAIEGRRVVVNEARPREVRPSGSYGARRTDPDHAYGGSGDRGGYRGRSGY